jgi:hypothetical protein
MTVPAVFVDIFYGLICFGAVYGAIYVVNHL